jgi:DNA-binding transcriptional MocR family regulator
MLRTFQIQVIEIPSHPRYGIITEALRQAMEDNTIQACFASTNFSTPLGSCMPDANKQELVNLLAEREIPLIEDDIYGDICFGSQRPCAAKCFDKSGTVLLCSSFSKSLAPGYRVGWVVPGRYKKEIELAKAIGNFATAMPPQIAIADFLASGGYDRHLRKIRRLYAQKTSLMAQAVTKFFPEGTRVTHPEGGFSLWVELPKYVDSLHLYEQARRRGISFVPGPLFSASFQRYRNFLRLNAAYWSDKAEKAIAAIAHLAEDMKP